MYYNLTFIASVTPPVFMTDNDDDNSQSYEGSVTSGTENWDAMRDEEFSMSLVFLGQFETRYTHFSISS
ncbi:hypothetical protein DPMN_155695 [Dreissena polymorpha]|uniref:Uncharacterized protein n=1 Tax=Dreissena polymorpha TaxID=45954 RepID=A0A9D4FMP1_DREPO|nr:hypothetical protein DPMN_155695 [Dreissena polymorpha]